MSEFVDIKHAGLLVLHRRQSGCLYVFIFYQYCAAQAMQSMPRLMEMIDHIPNDRQGVFFGGRAALFAFPTASWQPAVTAVLGSVYAKAKPRSSGRLAG